MYSPTIATLLLKIISSKVSNSCSYSVPSIWAEFAVEEQAASTRDKAIERTVNDIGRTFFIFIFITSY